MLHNRVLLLVNSINKKCVLISVSFVGGDGGWASKLGVMAEMATVCICSVCISN